MAGRCVHSFLLASPIAGGDPLMPRPVWVRTDDQTEAVHALEMAAEQLEKVLEEPYRWKWVIVATFNSLQAFMAAALQGTAGIGAMRNDYIEQWHEANEKSDRPKMEPVLASFNTLWDRCRSDKWICGFIDSSPLTPTAPQAASIASLKKWRDAFIHYQRGSLSIEVGGFPEDIRDSFDVIEFLAFRSGHLFRMEVEMSMRTRAALNDGRAILDSIDSDYEA